MTDRDERSWAALDHDVLHALLSDLTIDFTTFGRISGRPHRIEIWMTPIDDRLFMTGTPGARDWYANVLANPACVIHLKQSVRIDLAAIATAISDAEQRRYLLTHKATAWYRDQGDEVDFLLTDAPLIELTRAPLS